MVRLILFQAPHCKDISSNVLLSFNFNTTKECQNWTDFFGKEISVWNSGLSVDFLWESEISLVLIWTLCI